MVFHKNPSGRSMGPVGKIVCPIITKAAIEMINDLFQKYVGMSDREFNSLLYLDTQDLKDLLGNGMDIGFHTESHFWFKDLDKNQTLSEIETPCSFFDLFLPKHYEINSVAYPYGNSTILARHLYKSIGVHWGFTSSPGHLKLNQNNLLLPRWDTVFLK